MALKSLVAALAAVALAASPAVAQPTAAPVSVAPAAEAPEGSEAYRGGILIPLAGIVIILLAVFYFTRKKDRPVSP